MTSSSVKVVESARDLGVIIDSQLSLSSHVAALCQSGFYHLIEAATSTLSVTTSRSYKDTSIQAFISCRLDYCNSLLYGVTDKLMRQVYCTVGAECCGKANQVFIHPLTPN